MIACVLKSGGDYEPKHVYALQAQCAKFLPGEDFVCLTDMDLDCATIPLLNDWAGWWAKVELFRLPSALYMDLDTILVGDCLEILDAAKGHDFVILRDFYRGKTNPNAMQSSLMYWSKPHTELYDQFLDGDRYCEGGDQIYIEWALRDKKVTYWQDITKGIVSFKADVLTVGLKPNDKIVAFHGKPRPWEQTRVAYAMA